MTGLLPKSKKGKLNSEKQNKKIKGCYDWTTFMAKDVLSCEGAFLAR